jgi:hypothetical protein
MHLNHDINFFGHWTSKYQKGTFVVNMNWLTFQHWQFFTRHRATIYWKNMGIFYDYSLSASAH